MLGADDAQQAVGHVCRSEERDALDVVPVQMRDEQVDGQRLRAVRVHEADPQLAEARARIEHEECARRIAHLDARGVAPVAHRRRSGRGDRATRSPEADVHLAARHYVFVAAVVASRSESAASAIVPIPSSVGFGPGS